MKTNKFILLIIIASTLLLCSCSNSNSNRYVVVSTGGNEGQFPVVLDTKTREIFVIVIEGTNRSPNIIKKSLDAATK